MHLQLELPNTTSDRNVKYFKAAEMIPSNSITGLSRSEDQPVIDLEIFRTLQADISKYAEEQSELSRFFFERIGRGKLMKTLQSLAIKNVKDGPELSIDKDMSLRQNLRDLREELDVLKSLFLIQGQLLDEMIKTCEYLDVKNQLFQAIDRLQSVRGYVQECELQVESLIRSCAKAIINDLVRFPY
ncbi:hypothetical protein K469DRAFT_692148 [Zopfia rhizophila CBS 207.26]|uniref:Uncharacterized protein n=1 Tax=Zopfia rhizophila CBS 207.26 TaxID=1314779 RepID=A0A6A6DNY6_9PEZI|nr:hypothetical protein K469DRAFT_692148 [Zopfia rhizophila CBS 207.26]